MKTVWELKYVTKNSRGEPSLIILVLQFEKTKYSVF